MFALVERALTTSWLAARTGVEPMRLDVMRRSGELVASRRPGSQEYLFPAWQFDASWRPLPVVRRVVAAARDAGLSDERLAELLNARVGIGGRERLADLVRAGDEEQVLGAVRTAAAAR